MWTIIKEDDYTNFLDENQFLYQYKEQLILDTRIINNEKYHLLPRLIYQKYPSEYIKQYSDILFSPKKLENSEELQFYGTLKEKQIIATSKFIEEFNKKGTTNGMLQAIPGFGKTVCAFYLISQIKLKTLIILDNSKLVDQWIERCEDFTNYKKEDIGIIVGDKCDLSKNICITLVQTLMSRAKNNYAEFYSKFRDAGFGLIIYDEAHATSSGPKFALSSLFFNTPNLIGLTATPYGFGLAKILMDCIIGKIKFKTSEYEEIPDIYFVNYNSSIGKYKQVLRRFSDPIKFTSKYNSYLPLCENYLKAMSSIIIKLQDKGHRTIVLVKTHAQIEAIVKELLKHNIKAQTLSSKNRNIDLDDTSPIIATDKFVGKGFDHKVLSAIVFGSPYKGKTSLIQYAGRILRGSTDKLQPVLYDLVDKEFKHIFDKDMLSKITKFNEEYVNKCNIYNVNLDGI